MSDIAIVGGGYTGLVAAYRLAKEGRKVTILEAADEVGGLASGFKIGGGNLEKAYHHLFKTDTDIISLVEELGLNDKLKWHNSSLSIYYENNLYPFMTPFDLLKFSPLNFIDRIRAGVVVLYLQKEKNWRKFLKISAYTWMKKWAGKNVTKVIWEPLLKGKFSSFYNKVSMGWLWARIHIRANSREKGVSKEKLGYFEGGFQVLTDKLVEVIKKEGVEIKTNIKITSARRKENKIEIVSGDGQKYSYDKVLFTTPSHIFAHIVKENKEATSEYIESLNSINYLGAVLLIFSSTQDLSKFYWHNINDLSSPFLVFINHTKLIDKSHYGGKNVYYIGAYVPHDHDYFSIDEKAIEQKWFEALKKMFPAFEKNQIEEKFLFRFKNAQHIVDENYEEKIPIHKTPIPGIFLSNFSQIFPEDRGTNYAVREGNRIADIISND